MIPSATTIEKGQEAEQLAVKYLRGQGYEIKAMNWRFCHLELDIVARDGNQLVIIEVKSRNGFRFEHPSEAISDQKIRRVIEAAEAYIQQTGSTLETRFDLITVIFLNPGHELEHFKDAFYPTL